MDTRELLKVDLKLLISLHVLLEERSVSRAAKRLFITQPAMSKTLSRLREAFDDPLFTRSSHGMQPTPRTLELAPQLETVLRELEQLVSTQTFDPNTYKGEITLALSEYIGIAVLPQLMARLQFMAPGLSLKSITRVENQMEQLAIGSLDFSIHIRHRDYSDDICSQSLGSNPPVILAREAHPLSGQESTWEAIAKYPIIRLYISDLEELEIFRDEENFGRVRNSASRGSFETSHLLTALEVLRNTDFLMPGPPFVLRNPTVGYKIQALPFPQEVNYQVEYMLVRHRRTEKSAVHNWLWEQILEVIGELKHGMA